MSDDVGAVFAALADPTRRYVVEHLLREGSTSVPALTSVLPITRQAVAKHLAILSGAGLVGSSRNGRETRYRVTPAPFGEAIEWMTRVGAEWDDRLARLQRAAARRSAS